MTKTSRLDKFLFAVRISKTRNLASELCRKERVIVNGLVAKPSKAIQIGDIMEIKFPPIIRTFSILNITENRLSAKLVLDYILETTPKSEFEKLNKAKENVLFKRDKGTGRPTKKERRIIDKIMDNEDPQIN